MPACLAWDCKESDMTEWLNWTENHDISILDSSVLLFVSAFLSFLLLGAIHCMNISCEFNSLFSHSSIDGYLSYFKFQFGSVTQSVKLSNFFFKETTCFFYYFILFYFIYLFFWSFFPKWLCHFTFPSTVYESSNCFMSLPMFVGY